MNYINLLLVFVPVAILGRFLNWSPLVLFVTSALGVIPLASLIGDATEALATRTGPRLGGLLNATLGNAAEVIISIFAIRAGLLELVKASITGSILGNLLLVLGASILLGGLRHGTQRFSRAQAGIHATQLILAAIALMVPSIFSHAIEPVSHVGVEYLSLGVATLMIAIYVLGVIYGFRQEAGPLARQAAPVEQVGWSVRRSLTLLAVATFAIAWLSEILVGSVEPVMRASGMTEFFLGVILIPIIGNVAEHMVAMQVALKNKMDLSLEISVGSSLQIALFVAPVLIFLSLLLGNPLTLVFNQFELIALAGAAIIATFISLDGESNWLEGGQLLVVYVILALAFFFLPTP